MARKIPNFFSRQQILKLFDNIQDADVMIAVFLALFCGLRVGEVVRLRKCDFDFEKRFLKIVNSKNPNKSLEGYGKDRMVALPQHIIVPLQMWFDTIGEDTFVFQTRLCLRNSSGVTIFVFACSLSVSKCLSLLMM